MSQMPLRPAVPVIPGHGLSTDKNGAIVDLAQFMVQSDTSIVSANCAACNTSILGNKLTWSMVSNWRMVLCADFRACNKRTGGYHQVKTDSI